MALKKRGKDLAYRLLYRTAIEGYDTNHDTKRAVPEEIPLYVVRSMVGTTGFEPATSTVSR